MQSNWKQIDKETFHSSLHTSVNSDWKKNYNLQAEGPGVALKKNWKN